jgi:hypothetical protein
MQSPRDRVRDERTNFFSSPFSKRRNRFEVSRWRKEADSRKRDVQSREADDDSRSVVCNGPCRVESRLPREGTSDRESFERVTTSE